MPGEPVRSNERVTLDTKEARRFFALFLVAEDVCMPFLDLPNVDAGKARVILTEPSAAAKAREATRTMNVQCITWLSSHPGQFGANVAQKFEDFTTWLDKCGAWELTRLIGALRFPRKLERQDYTWVNASWWQFVQQLASTDHVIDNKFTPIFQRIYAEWVERTLTCLDEDLPEKNTIHILLDTMILVGLISEHSESHHSCVNTWRHIVEHVRSGSVQVHVTNATLRELRGLIERSCSSVLQMTLEHLHSKSGIHAMVHDTLDDFSNALLEGVGGPGFNGLVDYEMEAVLDLISEVETQPVCRIPTVVPELDYLSTREIGAQVAALWRTEPALKRTFMMDYHDVLLTRLASTMNERYSDQTWIVWSHHSALPQYANALGLRSYLVTYGPSICLLLKRVNVSELRERLREFIERETVEWTAVPEAAERLARFVDKWDSGFQVPHSPEPAVGRKIVSQTPRPVDVGSRLRFDEAGDSGPMVRPRP